MKIVAVNQYYLPDLAPTGARLHDLCRILVERGHEVRVVCSRYGYADRSRYPAREGLDGVSVQRVGPPWGGINRGLLRLLRAWTFAAACSRRLKTMEPKPELILALTTPPYLGLVARSAALRRGCRHAHWVMDVYPDVLAAHGLVKRGSAFYGRLEGFAKRLFEGSTLTVALSPDMADRIRTYTDAVSWIPLWAAPGLSPWPRHTPNPVRQQRGWRDDELIVMYSGNMGLGHRFAEFLDAAAEGWPGGGTRWVFSGGGPRRREVEAACRNIARACVLPYAEPDRLREHLCSADVHLASMDAEWRGCLVPSKLQSIFAVGRPVVFVGPPEASLAKWIRESGGGWVVAEGDRDGLRAALQQAAQTDTRDRKGRAARAYAERHFDARANGVRMAELLETACGADGSTPPFAWSFPLTRSRAADGGAAVPPGTS